MYMFLVELIAAESNKTVQPGRRRTGIVFVNHSKEGRAIDLAKKMLGGLGWKLAEVTDTREVDDGIVNDRNTKIKKASRQALERRFALILEEDPAEE